MNTFTKCTAKKDGYSETQCKALKSSVTLFLNNRAKGLFYSPVVDLKTSQSLGIAILIKSEQIPRGVHLNFCPFCGGELRDTSEDSNKSTTSENGGCDE